MEAGFNRLHTVLREAKTDSKLLYDRREAKTDSELLQTGLRELQKGFIFS